MPESVVAGEAAPGEVPRGGRGHRERAQGGAVAPVQFGDARGGDAPALEMRADGQSSAWLHGRGWPRVRERRCGQGGVVVVRGDHRVEGRQLADGEGARSTLL